jgi:hypothetical protein
MRVSRGFGFLGSAVFLAKAPSRLPETKVNWGKMATSKTSISSATKAKAPVAGKSAVAKLKKDKAAGASKPEHAEPAMSDESLSGVVALEDRWFAPKTIGAIFGLDEKWLGSIREGLKGIDGPPFKKLGSGRSAPIRYNYGKFKDWFDKFPSLINTQGKLAARAGSVLGFFSERNANNQWLFAEVNGEPQDIVVAINSGAFDGEGDPQTYWLTYWEWLAKAAQSGRMALEIDKLLSQISENAIAIHEDDDFRATVPKAKPTKKK